ncbi:N-acetylglucosamine-6-phosphate deacetylase [Piptocephalis cylindrospora]|uniref:N-acetylglucosamine-6-phosphate deacetylase n=1 Tax=Piptocephalis cylindrospora TaxID=1907219 RepID=A0A4P9Y3A3_9FUNG|nr:N-acetylglucosamine-6-phosphate deacetylase [Piptocephalis cylindrospora]|eukprot:RKP13283.1 N-acetylglucosamine-6-phosphate deacetylase [Piptocephalis cylindrospora]
MIPPPSAPLSTQDDLVTLGEIREKKAFLIDMDGVIYHGSKLLPGAPEFVRWMQKTNKKFLFLTNNPAYTPRELQEKLQRLGIAVEESNFFTSCLATAKFLQHQSPKGGSCFVIGHPALTYALYEHGFTMNETNPDYVVVGEGRLFNYDNVQKACHLVHQGARLIGANPDQNSPGEGGLIDPACGAFTGCIEQATGRMAFYCGKPCSVMMRYAQRILGTNRREVCIIGDRMDTDILGGINSEMDSVLVLSGISSIESYPTYPFQPTLVLEGVFQIPPHDDTTSERGEGQGEERK